MKNKKVVIRVDGNSKIGLGHIYRGIAIAHMLKNDFDIEFIIRTDSDILPLKEINFKYTNLPANISITNEPLWFKENYSSENTILILDGYQFDDKFQKRIKENNFKLVYIDDMVSFHQYADVVINHSPGIKEEDYSAEPYTKFALGTDYALLRPAFLKAAKQARKISKIDTAFVCFGGSDIYDLSYTVSKSLLEIEQINKINVVIGNAYKHTKIFMLGNIKINIYKNLSEKDLLKIMLESNIGITSASTILFELACVKMPIISGISAENQKHIYQSFYHKNAIFGIDNFKNITIENIIKAIKTTLLSNNTSSQIENQQKLFDGKAKERLIKVIKNI